ncbi:MAG: AAA family ATPase [Alphaproteobacteria bacterium]|nr:AAA family ATPase [Alphaproteobacteria bacterium]
MKFNNQLYYNEKNTTIKYSYDGPGEMDVDRLVQQKTYYKKDNADGWKPKTLILADWTAPFWGLQKIDLIHLMLQTWLDEEGGSLYLWQQEDDNEGKLIKLTKENLNCLRDSKMRQAIKPAFPHDLTVQLSIETKKAFDTIHVLDDYWICQLIEMSLNERRLDITAFEMMQEQERNKITDIINASFPPLQAGYYTCWNDGLGVHYPSKEEYRQLFEKHFNSKQIYLDPLDLFSCSNRIFHNKEFLINNKDKLLSLYLKNSSITPDLMEVLSNLRLEKFTIELCTVAPETQLNRLNPEYFNRLELHNNEILPDQVEQLLKNAYSLEYLKISNFSYNHDGILPFTCTKNLHTFEAILSKAVHFDEIIKNSPNLEELVLSQCNFQDKHYSKWAGHNFSKLRLLNVSGSDIDENDLIEIIKNAPHLEELNIAHCKKLSQEFFTVLSSFSLEKIKNFSLTVDSSINATVLHELFKKMPNLERLGVYIDVLTEVFSNLYFKELKYITINSGVKYGTGTESFIKPRSSPITPFQLEWLITRSPQLKNLDLINSSLLPEEVSELRKKFEHVTVYHHSIEPMANKELSDPKHNYREFHDYKPNDPNEPFIYRGENQSLDQNMVIEKLSQYWTLTDSQHKQHIPAIQNGICSALSRFFVDESYIKRLFVDEMNIKILLELMRAWDGSNTISDEFQKCFSTLEYYVLNYQLSPTHNKKHFVGTNISALLEKKASNNSGETLLLSNTWHHIALEYKVNGEFIEWIIYDPNYVEGPKSFGRDSSPDKVIKALEDSLGNCISIDIMNPSQDLLYSTIEPRIPDYFIEEGGLLTLAILESSQVKRIVERLQSKPLQPNTFSGLLLRCTEGYPAWFRGVSSENPVLSAYTNDLIQQFREIDQDADIKLKRSLEALGPQACVEGLDLLFPHLKNEHQALLHSLKMIEESSQHPPVHPLEARLREKLSTWERKQKPVDSVENYCEKIVNATFKEKPLHKLAIEFTSSDDVYAFHLHLEKACINSELPVFYVSSPDDLICFARHITRNGDNMATIHQAPSGPLHDFLKQYQNDNPVLIINYDKFDSDDMVKFNTILDDIRMVDGVNIPESTLIIGLLNTNKPNAYCGADFYSRYTKVIKSPFKEGVLRNELLPLPILEMSDEYSDPKSVINLYHTADWKEELLGRWMLKKDHLEFEEGLLAPALKHMIETYQPIKIHNAPWHNPDFRHFWELALLRWKIEHAGNTIVLPKNLRLTTHDGYSLQNLAVVVQNEEFVETTIDESIFVLNPTEYNRFFVDSEYEESTHSITMKPGIIKQQAEKQKDLRIYYTRGVNDHQWAKFLTHCKDAGIESVKVHTLVFHENSVNHTKVYTSNDVDSVVAIIAAEARSKNQTPKIIDVSECGAGDVLKKLVGRYVEDTNQFIFNETKSVLLEALSNHETVILKGAFSAELSDALMPLLIKRLQDNAPPSGNLHLVPDNPQHFNVIKWEQWFISPEHKRNILEEDGIQAGASPQLMDEQLQNESLSQLKARQRYMSIHSDKPAEASTDAWIGMNSLPGGVSMPPFDLSKSKERSDAFVEDRMKQVKQGLKHSPFVVLTGLTGVGKTTFVQKYLSQSVSLHQGLSELNKWINDKSDGDKVLFIDEANAMNSHWSQFEGLFNDPPSIFINGEYHRLTPEHKVVFACNPLSYEGGRTLPALFRRHGNAILFEPMIMEHIYETQLKTLLAKTALESESLTIATIFLNAYQQVCRYSQDRVLISSREVQQMALLVLAKHNENPQLDPKKLAHYYAYEVARALVPAAHKEAFDQGFKKDRPFDFTTCPLSHYKMTAKRQPVAEHIHDVLTIQGLRRDPKCINKKSLRAYPGQSGIILEGKPGDGKSLLVESILEARGYKNRSLDAKDTPGDRIYYKIPLGMQATQKTALLRKAFDEGAVVLMDEINSSPLMEPLLNALLGGKTPEGKKATKAGFLVIGTQNPVTMAGRYTMSDAGERRFKTVHAPSYSRNEMKSILIEKGYSLDLIKVGIKVYEERCDYARKNHIRLEPTFRDLERILDKLRAVKEKITERTETGHARSYTSRLNQQGTDKNKTIREKS